MNDTGKKKKKTPVTVCPVLDAKNKNELLVINPDFWNTQDSRTFIMNADFRQMDSAKDKR